MVKGWQPRALISTQRERIRALERAQDQLALVLRINNLLISELDPERLFRALSSALWQEVRHEFMSLTRLEPGGESVRVVYLHTPERCDLPEETLEGSLVGFPSGQALRLGRTDILGPADLARMDPRIQRHLEAAGIRSMCCIPLIARGQTLGCLAFGSCAQDHFSGEEAAFLGQIGAQMALALDNALAFRHIQTLKDKLAEEKVFLEEEAGQDFGSREIIGAGPALTRVLKQIAMVAPTDSTVLLTGETGTGKELLARNIHQRSRRREHMFVKLNCAAIPLGLLESELFGHERGAFTGAIQRKTGRFELAHQGTLFLDEVGDLPLELQPKLLRAIQEREFERLGSNVTLKADVRIIAATHRPLTAMVKEGKFREDLFYRLNVFPIQAPPLRARKEDIPGLVAYFTQKFARQLDRKIVHIPAATMERLMAWSWPGNIRELQNIIERSVILSQGGELRVPLADLERALVAEHPLPASVAAAPRLEASASTLEEVERQAIREALEACRWVIGGPGGAAARLGLKRTTLNARMRKLGITRQG